MSIALEQLLTPVRPSHFVGGYWGRRTLHLKGVPSRLDGLSFGFDALHDILCGPKPPKGVSLSFTDRDGRHGAIAIDPRDYALLDGGPTLRVSNIGAHHAPLAQLGAELKDGLLHPGQIRFDVHASTRDRGTCMHVDMPPVIVMQIEGVKRWRVAVRPSVQWPPTAIMEGAESIEPSDFARRYPKIAVEPPKRAEFMEIELHPGDALFIPAGTWHEATAVTRCLAVRATMIPLTFGALLSEQLDALFLTHPEYRGSLPLDTGDPQAVAAYLDGWLERMRMALSALKSDDLRDRWTAHLLSEQEPGPVDPADTLLVPRALSLKAIPRPDHVAITAAGRSVELPAAATAFAESLVAVPCFRANTATDWAPGASWDTVAPVLQALVDAGLLRRRAHTRMAS